MKKIKNAVISVSDKKKLNILLKVLKKNKINLLSSTEHIEKLKS